MQTTEFWFIYFFFKLVIRCRTVQQTGSHFIHSPPRLFHEGRASRRKGKRGCLTAGLTSLQSVLHEVNQIGSMGKLFF